jgi:C-terminal processing protease CtpA/Prc
LGLGFFRRHQVVFDFAGLKLYLQPGRRFFLPDQEDRSGLHLLRENQATIAYSVDEGSPAFNCGVRAGDIITSINGKEANSLTLNVIRHLLQSDDGDRVTLQIRRENCPLNFEFTLKPAI